MKISISCVEKGMVCKERRQSPAPEGLCGISYGVGSLSGEIWGTIEGFKKNETIIIIIISIKANILSAYSVLCISLSSVHALSFNSLKHAQK